MHPLWNPSRFTGITDYQTWEDALLDDDDITEHVRAGKLVPINIGGDGVFQFLVRVGTAAQAATLTGREKHHLPASGHPCPTIPPGPNAVTIHLINWDSGPGARDTHGKPKSWALPDFVVLISPEDPKASYYRIRLQTSDRG